jgi:hypothetical protein
VVAGGQYILDVTLLTYYNLSFKILKNGRLAPNQKPILKFVCDLAPTALSVVKAVGGLFRFSIKL